MAAIVSLPMVPLSGGSSQAVAGEQLIASAVRRSCHLAVMGASLGYSAITRYFGRLLLRARRRAEQRDEHAAPHSITSSARASRVAGTSRPRALAVLRLMTSSYLVGACTGRSAGFSPRRMRST